MATAVVTGATSGIGKAITTMLLERGYFVYGIGRDFSKVGFDTIAKGEFEAVECDLRDTKAIEYIFLQLQAEPIDLLINSAGFGLFDPLEEMNMGEIEEMLAVNLQAPLLITHLLLRTLKKHKGVIVNISSIEAVRSSKFASIYTATKAGLRAFGLALFEEVRKSGVKVLTINADITDTAFYDALRFEPHHDSDAYIEAESIANCVSNILDLSQHSVVTEMTIRPQIVRIEKKC